MFDREIEREDIDFCQQFGIGILAHSPLAKGLLTGKYSPDFQFPADDERSNYYRFQGKLFSQYLAAADKLKKIAHQKVTLVQLSIAWALRLPAISCVLVGAKTADQAREQAVVNDSPYQMMN